MRWASTSVRRGCALLSLEHGVTDYDAAWRYQRVLLEHAATMQKTRQEDVSDSLLLVEHPRILTLGRGATTTNIKPRAAESATPMPRVVRIERGGEVTWHGPGQLVAYPILNLSKPPHRRDLHWYTNALEECVIQALGRYGVVGHRSPVNTGVWVGTNKIAAIGVSASRWFTYHGVSINVNPSMEDYKLIVPCGIANPDHGVCSLHQLLVGAGSQAGYSGGDVSVVTFGGHFSQAFEDVFGVSLQPRQDPLAHLEALLDAHPELREQSPALPVY